MFACSISAISLEELSARVLPDASVVSFDHERFLTRCLGNRGFAERMLTKFQELFAGDVAEIAEAGQRGDAEHVARVAHRLTGSLATLSAGRLREVLSVVEQQSRAGQLALLPQLLELVAVEWSLFLAQVANCSYPVIQGPVSPVLEADSGGCRS